MMITQQRGDEGGIHMSVPLSEAGARQAFTLQTEVLPTGKIEATVPLLPGTRVQLIVLAEDDDDCSDLLRAAASTMGFWDNPEDDAEWNHL
jgi:hypothetical protein